jgi:ABC-2 type transport system permease protein
MFIVLRREFLERVRSKGFLIGTVLFPLLMGALWIVPAMLGEGGGTRKIVIVDQAPAGLGQIVEQVLTHPEAAHPASAGASSKDDEDRITYVVTHETRPLAAVKADLIRRVQAKEIDGWLYLPPDLVQTSQAQYRARDVANFMVIGDLSRATSRAVQAARLQASGIAPAQVAALVKPVQLATGRITDKGEEGGSAQGTFWLAYIFGLLTYMMILLYGVNVMRSVLEEKTNKISEVIVSSMRASHLMLGKILGVGAVALLQVGIWITAAAVAVSRSDAVAAHFHIDPKNLDIVHLPLGMVLGTVGFFIMGFLLYSAVYAALGAAVNSEQEAQQLQIFVLIPVMLPIAFLVRIVTDPLGHMATVLGMIPFTAPVTMAMRMASTTVPAAQVIGSLLGLLVTVLIVAWIAGKIYRVGILSTGKKPSLAELGRWLRAA